MPPGSPESGWTGRHDDMGRLFPASRDGAFAWSAAFVSYVMRIAGAGAGFPYAADHASYIDAAVQADRSGSTTWIVHAERLDRYSPVPGDLVCMGRGEAADLRFDNLPAGHFPGHCDVVVGNTVPGLITVVGGNVNDAVTMKHIPVTSDGRLATPEGIVLDTRYPWLLVLRTGSSGSGPIS